MRNVAFVVWMLGWPWLLAAYPTDRPLSDPAMLVFTAIWVGIAIITYERKDTTK